VETDVTGWVGADFGTASVPNVTSVSLAFAGSNWSPTSTSLCCQLYAEAGNSGYQCPGDTTLLGTAALTGYSYTWLENGTQVGTGSYLEITYGAGGTYTVNVTASGSGCAMATDFAIVVDEPKPDL
jgi:hypothetical protein